MSMSQLVQFDGHIRIHFSPFVLLPKGIIALRRAKRRNMEHGTDLETLETFGETTCFEAMKAMKAKNMKLNDSMTDGLGLRQWVC